MGNDDLKKGDAGGHRKFEKEVDVDDVCSADLEEEAKETLARMAPKFMQSQPPRDAEGMQWQRF